MNLSVNGQSQVPPGFRFHPTEEELLQYYLQKKVANQKIDLDVIQDIDLNRLEPWDIQEKCKIGSTPQNDWYFFSHKDKKYPTGTRTNRATVAGFWKATGRDKVIYSSLKRIGMRKTLVFYMGRAPHGEKSDWIMHEYRLDDNTFENNGMNLSGDQSFAAEEGWVVCRVFRKKNYVKALDNPNWSSKTSPEAHDLDEILSYMEKTTTKEESKRKISSNKINNITVKYTENTQNPLSNADPMVQDRFMHLPHLDSPIPETIPFDPVDSHHETMINYAANDHHHAATSTVNWVELDRLVAYQLNGQQTEHSESRGQLPYFTNDTIDGGISPFPLLSGIDGSNDRIATNTFSFQHLLRSQPSRAFEADTNGDQTWTQFAAASWYDIS